MRDSKDWIRQPMVDEKADAIVAAGKHSVTEITAYQIAKGFGCSANPALHEKIRDWRRRRLDQAAASAITVPPKLEEELGDALDRMTAEVKAVFLGMSERLRGDVERSLMPRVVDAERRRDAADAETDQVLELCRKMEEEFSDALLKIDALEQAVLDGRIREERLAGRLEQRNADWATALRQGLRDAPQKVPSDGSDSISEGTDAPPVAVTKSVSNEQPGETPANAE